MAREIPSASVNGVSVGNSTAVSAKKKQQWEVAYVCVIEVGELGNLIGQMATIKESGKQAVIVGVMAYINELGIKSLKVRLHRDKKQLRTLDEIEI